MALHENAIVRLGQAAEQRFVAGNRVADARTDFIGCLIEVSQFVNELSNRRSVPVCWLRLRPVAASSR